MLGAVKDTERRRRKMSVRLIEREYGNYGKCLFLENDAVTLGVTAEVGPRIIYFALKGLPNVLFEDTERQFIEDVGEFGSWYAYGGHRLWTAPETKPETYFPDNEEIRYAFQNGKLTVSPASESFGRKISVEIELDEHKAEVRLSHVVDNISDKPIKLAPWSVTGLAAGGVCRIPLCTRKSGYLPNRVMSLWDYSDIADPRLRMTDRDVRLRQDRYIKKAFKAGFNVEDGFAAYAVNGQIFVKQFGFEDTDYPDYCCNFEVYTNDLFLECEALGELREYQPHEKATLKENWRLFEDPDGSEPDLDKLKALLN